MEKEKLMLIIARNMIEYRKQSGMTQAELAAKLNYSDKSISKWERGDGVPDIFVLRDLADIYGITVNDLLADGKPKPIPEKTISEKVKLYITLLSAGLVWLVASFVFFVIKLAAPDLEKAWLTFVVAMPCFFIVLIVFCALWWGKTAQCISVSGLVWSLALAIHQLVVLKNVIYIYIIAMVLQVLTVLWFLLSRQRILGKKSK